MIYDSAVTEVKDKERKTDDIIRLATVTNIFSDGCAKVVFFGETSESEKKYPFMGSYNPSVNDIVAMIKQGNTYIILGSVKISNASVLDHNHNQEYAQIEHEHTMLYSTTGKLIEFNGSSLVPSATGINIGSGSTSFTYNNGFFNNVYALSSLSLGGNVTKQYNATVNLGTHGTPIDKGYFDELYIDNSPVSTSDKNKKKEIKSPTKKYLDFLMKLKPKTYKFKKNTSDRKHCGFIAQEVEEALIDSGLTTKDFAGYVKQEDGSCGLRYEEFVSLNTFAIQCLQEKITELSSKVNQLQKEVNKK